MIVADARGRPPVDRNTVVYLGDYVDRGSGSFEVIEILLRDPLKGFHRVHLRGNHEELMLRFLRSGNDDGIWIYNGGDATLASYGLAVPWAMTDSNVLFDLARRFRAAVPANHLAFLEGLQLSYVCGDYLMVHAGVRPGLAIEQQRPADMIWIRDTFLLSDKDFGKRVVHGHTISGEPEVRANRIGIDTGAFCTGRLTCLVLEGEEVAFLRT